MLRPYSSPSPTSLLSLPGFQEDGDGERGEKIVPFGVIAVAADVAAAAVLPEHGCGRV